MEQFSSGTQIDGPHDSNAIPGKLYATPHYHHTVPRGQSCWRLGLVMYFTPYYQSTMPRGQSCWRLGFESAWCSTLISNFITTLVTLLYGTISTPMKNISTQVSLHSVCFRCTMVIRLEWACNRNVDDTDFSCLHDTSSAPIQERTEVCGRKCHMC